VALVAWHIGLVGLRARSWLSSRRVWHAGLLHWRKMHPRPQRAPFGQAAIAVVIFTSCSLMGWPQASLDPLRLAEPSAGEVAWKVTLGYSACGREGFGFDEFGEPYSFTCLEQDSVLSAAGIVTWSALVSFGATVTAQRSDVRERRQFADRFATHRATAQQISFLAWQQSRLNAQSALDPRLTLSAGYPASLGLSFSLSLLRDPIVLAVEAGARHVRSEASTWMLLDLTTGFVANSSIRLTCFAGIEVSAIGAGLPSGRLGGEMRYVINPGAGQELAIRSSLTVRGERAALRVDVEISGAGQ
jgi:hypothetical protein